MYIKLSDIIKVIHFIVLLLIALFLSIFVYVVGIWLLSFLSVKLNIHPIIMVFVIIIFFMIVSMKKDIILSFYPMTLFRDSQDKEGKKSVKKSQRE